MTREQLTNTRRKIFCELDSYMKAVCKGTEYYKQWQLWFNCVVNFCDIRKDEIIFLEGIKVFDEILSKLIEEEGTAEEVSGNEVDENEHKKCIMRLEARKARKEKEIIKALQPCTDEISRANTIDEISHIIFDHPLDGYEDGQLILETIQDMPPVTPAEKTGKWIDGKCNRCGTHAPYWAMASTYYCSDYCPKCGSRMMQEVEE